jgi:general stress protein 26
MRQAIVACLFHPRPVPMPASEQINERKSEQNHNERIWELIEKIGVCMLTTQSADSLHARPVEARAEASDKAAGLIYVVTDVRSTKADEIAARPAVVLTFVDQGEKAYLSITGRAKVLRDVTKTRELWRKTDELWWSGYDDPNVCLLRIEAMTAELWDGPASNAVFVWEFLKATVTGAEPELGQNRKVTVQF